MLQPTFISNEWLWCCLRLSQEFQSASKTHRVLGSVLFLEWSTTLALQRAPPRSIAPNADDTVNMFFCLRTNWCNRGLNCCPSWPNIWNKKAPKVSWKVPFSKLQHKIKILQKNTQKNINPEKKAPKRLQELPKWRRIDPSRHFVVDALPIIIWDMTKPGSRLEIS